MKDYYSEIKNELISNEINHRVKDYSKNKNDLTTYYEVGRLLIEAQGGEKRAKYGDNLIKEFSNKLQKEVGKKYNVRTLRRIRQFYLLFYKEKWSPMATELTWSHYQELLSLKDVNSINYYIEICLKNNLSRNKLREKIKSKEYERLSEETKNKLITNTKLEVQDLVKNPIIINNPSNKDIITEKTLKLLILEDLDNFLLELGDGFTYIANEYKIRIGNTYNYIDLLLFNIKYNCYVVVELKITELKKEHIGQIQIYMNYIDNNLKRYNMNKTIGLIIVKKDNRYVIEYCSDKRIISKEYKLV
jgi:predicted nuclease of restriction endonuclease-like (RecB) superfamily